jgi:hypothetical protein
MRSAEIDRDAFKAEAKAIRKALKELQRDRYKRVFGAQNPDWRHLRYRVQDASLKAVLIADELDARLAPYVARLRYWLQVLATDRGNNSRIVSLRRSWFMLRMAAESEANQIAMLRTGESGRYEQVAPPDLNIVSRGLCGFRIESAE